MIRFEMAICEDEPELLSVSRGFGELDALALLPTLRCELAPLLTACADGTLTREMVRLNMQSCAVLMLGAEQPGAWVRGLADVAKKYRCVHGRGSVSRRKADDCRAQVAFCVRQGTGRTYRRPRSAAGR